MTKQPETIRVPIVADGVYAGVRALKGFASTGLGSPFYTVQTRRENAIRVLEARVPLDVFALMDEHSDQIRRGIDKVALTTARRNALKVARRIEPLAATDLWASKSLFSEPAARTPATLDAHDTVRASVFAWLFAEVQRGRPSLDALRESMLGDDEERGEIAVHMVRLTWPAIPDWYWHPDLAIPPWVDEQLAELRAGKRERVILTDEALDAARLELLEEEKLRGRARAAATRQLAQRAIDDRKRKS